MIGIYFINERISINNLSWEESILFQEQSIKNYLLEQNIQAITLNPLQLKEYYTNPHALLYDLRKIKSPIDCFIYFSSQTVEDFIYSYPAKWLILKSFFNEIILIEQQIERDQQQAI
ncbi:hypothetical protein [Neobacillus cucumis]|uniref:hypothetical protein n=1 Tax=Neobacillus cucumis TaxID=1740721 RepID=UPI00285350F7|nr:hypothetical protein [Neobacillus cucumis]MDR4946857.1 hypothetical protein [Neobacillus cucumis]